MSEPMNVDRLRDLYRVHDTSKKQKKEKRRAEDDREFRDFLDESESEPEGYKDYAPEETVEEVPANKMLNMLGAHPIQHFKIEPLEPIEKSETAINSNPAAEKKTDNEDSQP